MMDKKARAQHIYQFIHSSVDGLFPFRLFRLTAFINTAVKRGVQVSLQHPTFNFFQYILRIL